MWVESICSKTYFKEDNPKTHTNQQRRHPEINVCNQCGECIDICPVMAIKRDKLGVVRITDLRGCFMCVGFCPIVHEATWWLYRAFQVYSLWSMC